MSESTLILTDQQSLLLSQFAYFNLNYGGKTPQQAANDYVANNYTLKDIINDWQTNRVFEESEQYGGITIEELCGNDGILDQIATDSVLGNLTLKGYVNNNPGNGGTDTGFVGYAFGDEDNTIFAFRGSEGSPAEATTGEQIAGFFGVDWRDNLATGLLGQSVQFADVEDFVNTYKGEENFVTGHSKGGMNALYACSLENVDITGKVFDAAGIDQALSLEARERLANSGVINYVAAGDIVGPMLYHSEERIWCYQKPWGSGPFAGHYTQVFDFNEDGQIITTARTVPSVLLELISQELTAMPYVLSPLLIPILDSADPYLQLVQHKLTLLEPIVKGKEDEIEATSQSLLDTIENHINEFSDDVKEKLSIAIQAYGDAKKLASEVSKDTVEIALTRINNAMKIANNYVDQAYELATDVGKEILSGCKQSIDVINNFWDQITNSVQDMFNLNEMFDSVFNDIKSLFNQAEIAVPPSSCPIILDLNGDGINTTDLASGAIFDLDANGFAEKVAWNSAKDGILVRDINLDGIINDGKELFGDHTILKNGSIATNGYLALADLDDNQDGIIDANDSAFNELKVWTDLDGDGYSLTHEIHTLQELGITAIATNYTAAGTVDSQGNIIFATGTYTKNDGSQGMTGDIYFDTDTFNTVYQATQTVPDDIKLLPDLQGHGVTMSLHQAMVNDSARTLKTLVEQFTNGTDQTTRKQIVTASP